MKCAHTGIVTTRSHSEKRMIRNVIMRISNIAVPSDYLEAPNVIKRPTT